MVRKVHQEYYVLRILIADLPSLYSDMADKIEAKAKEDADTVSDG